MEMNLFRKDALRRACAGFVGSEDRWGALVSSGATDQEIIEMLSKEMWCDGGSSGPGWLPECHKHNPPQVWLGEVTPKGKATLAGKDLINAVRRIFGIREKAAEGQLMLFEW